MRPAHFQPWKVDQRVFFFNDRKISSLHIDPQRNGFLFWFFISCYGPVLTAATGPVANMLSVASIINKWRQNSEGQEIDDSHGIYVLNIISLIIGCFSNVVLFLHFSDRLSYITSQVINIIGWSLAALLLAADLILCWKTELQYTAHEKGIGFWYAFYTTIIYVGCVITLSIHFIGFKMGKYVPKFNLSKSERAVMMYTLWLAVWFMWGAGMFSKLMKLTYGVALYYCVVSTTTVGLGDVVPQTVASRIMCMVFFFSGLLILGLIVSMTRTIVQKSFRPILSLNRTEKTRAKLLKDNKETMGHYQDYRNNDQFSLMRTLHAKSLASSALIGACLSVFIFIVFWTLGAMIFMFTESWDYFDALYFCFLCLITIGYGDFVPSTNAGRTFFVVWALSAIPMMTILINSVGEFMFELGWSLADDSNKFFKKVLTISLRIAKRLIQRFFNDFASIFKNTQDGLEDENYDDESNDSDDQELKGLEELTRSDSHSIRRNRIAISNRNMSTENKMNHLWTLAKDYSFLSSSEPQYKLSYSEWVAIFSLLPDEQFNCIYENNFWISDISPLRYDLNEPRFAYLQLASSLAGEMKKLLKEGGTFENGNILHADVLNTTLKENHSFNEDHDGDIPSGHL